MERAEFVNDLCCNYLTVPYGGGENEFALRMIMENVTDVFLPVELRRLDGENYLYYNISGLQNMEILYAERPIDRKTFQMLMQQLHEAIEESRELFLPGDGICLEPPLLFWDMRKERWEFVYVPGGEKRELEEIQKEREQLAEFLVMHIDYEDKNLTDIVYRFYEEICSGKINPGYFEMEKTGKMEAAWDTDNVNIKKNKNNQNAERLNMEQADEGDYDIRISEKYNVEADESDEFEINKSEKEAGGQKIKPQKKGRIRVFKIIVCIFCSIAAVITVLSGRIAPDMRLPGAAATVLLAALLFHIHRKQKSAEEDENSQAEDILYTEAEEIPYDIETAPPGEMEKLSEETVYMDIKQEQERKLYGIGKFRQQKIFLDKLPCLIGKDESLVNHIIPDVSISRMHARFFEENRSLWMQDLNSKNGTYHNGLRLRPNEKVMLEPEDEIGFGRAQFVFR